MAIYINKETNGLVRSYKFTGDNQKFIISKLISECNFAETQASEIAGKMKLDDVVVMQYHEDPLSVDANGNHYEIMNGEKFLVSYDAYKE